MESGAKVRPFSLSSKYSANYFQTFFDSMCRRTPPYTYFQPFKKCFNPSAIPRKSLEIRVKLAEGFDFSTLQ
ncbi:MAG: hypothetical protein SPK03_08705, partial [Alloprevotella sp.]|nr:hypothetical protein [Alloprevotella sp.]